MPERRSRLLSPGRPIARETVDGWSQLRPDDDLIGLGLAMVDLERATAEELLERTAIASGLRRRGDYEVLALLRRAEPVGRVARDFGRLEECAGQDSNL